MTSRQPYVLEKCTLLEYIQHVLNHHTAASWLIVCSSGQALKERLASELAMSSQETVNLDLTLDATPTMRTIASCSTLQVAFAPDLAHLRGFLASIRYSQPCVEGAAVLAILDPVQVHQPTTGYSAQGIHRTMALAIDVAHALRATLVIHESHSAADAAERSSDPWALEVGIVDTRTKTFGPGSRGWVGRTVKLRDIAQRWMTFKQIEHFL